MIAVSKEERGISMKQKIKEYQQYLVESELSDSTIRSYVRAAENFTAYLGRRKMSKQIVLEYKRELQRKGYRVSTMNLYIIAVNKFVRFCGEEQCTVKTKRYQRRQSLDNIISEEDYRLLLEYALETGRNKYYLIMKTMALTGIRVGELQYITVEALKKGYTQVNNKGKVREIYIPDCLVALIYTYCEKEGIEQGAVFRGRGDKPITRTAVWKMLNYLADMVGIEKEKVYPHSFRHFFALSYMKEFSNIFELADILGHSSLETTRIYTTASIEQKRERMGALDKV